MELKMVGFYRVVFNLRYLAILNSLLFRFILFFIMSYFL